MTFAVLETLCAGGPEAALLLVEATMYDYLELLQQHTQLCASLGNEGGEEGDGGEQAHASAAAALHLCGQVSPISEG